MLFEAPFKSVRPSLADFSDASTDASDGWETETDESPDLDFATRCLEAERAVAEAWEVPDWVVASSVPHPSQQEMYQEAYWTVCSGLVCDVPPSQDLEWCFAAPAPPSASWEALQQSQAYAPEDVPSAAGGSKTTVMLRNLPNDYTRSSFLDLLDRVGGFAGAYDFVYLPVDFKRQAGLGYGFVNFVSPAEAQRCMTVFERFSQWTMRSSKTCSASWGEPLQGLDAHIERYRNSPVMHASVPEEWKPLIFQSGVPVAFPSPTKGIRPPQRSRN